MKALVVTLLLLVVCGCVTASGPRSATPADHTSDTLVQFHERLRRGNAGGVMVLVDPEYQTSVQRDVMLLVAIYTDSTGLVTLDRWVEVGRYPTSSGLTISFLVWSIVTDNEEHRRVDLPVVLYLNQQGQIVVIE